MRPMIGVAALFLTFAVGSASAHEKGCNGSSVPKSIKVNCCGKAEDHLLEPEQVTRGANDEYIVSVEGLTLTIPSNKALPSSDSCSHIFFAWESSTVGEAWTPKKGGFWTPAVYCFLTPMND